MKKFIVCLMIVLGIINSVKGVNGIKDVNEYELKSPNEKIIINISVGDEIMYSVKHGNTTIIKDSPISMELEDGSVLGRIGQIGALGEIACPIRPICPMSPIFDCPYFNVNFTVVALPEASSVTVTCHLPDSSLVTNE